MLVKNGDKIKVEYKGTLNDGTVFDSSEKHGKPLEFQVGSGQIIKGFDEAVKGMAKGEEKNVKIPSQEAYGQPNPQLVQKVLKQNLPKDQEVKPGMALLATTPDGKQIPAKVSEVNENDVTIDLNHPLAGKDLNFKIKVVEVSN
jgi:FKBP-type peptidyl-prolyl cis-trans isomerase 2